MQKTALEHDLQKLVEKALALGASGAKTVDVASIRTGAWTRWKCQFAAADLSMSNGLLEILLNLEREAFLQNHYKAFALKAGRCRLCKECNLKQCVNPTKARPSLEACGIDVMALANDNGYQAEILQAAVPELKIYGLLLVE